MNCERIKFSGHSVRRMFERGIKKQSVIKVIRSGEIIDSYLEDEPYPSFLMLGFENNVPIHVVVARDEEISECHVISVYFPKPDIWQDGYMKRRKS